MYNIYDIVNKAKTQRMLRRVLALLCVIVILFTTNAIKRKADTLVHAPDCGFPDHTHDATCFVDGVLVCEKHVHTDACYQTRPVEDALMLEAATEEEEAGEDAPLADEDVDSETEAADETDVEMGDVISEQEDESAEELTFMLGEELYAGDEEPEITMEKATETGVEGLTVEEEVPADEQTPADEAEDENAAVEEQDTPAVEETESKEDAAPAAAEPAETTETEENTEAEQPSEDEQPAENESEQPTENEDEQSEENEDEQPTEDEGEQPTENEDEQSEENEDEQPAENEDEQSAENEDEQPTEDESEQPAENEDEQPAEDESEQPEENEDEQPAENEDEQPDEADPSDEEGTDPSDEASAGEETEAATYTATIELNDVPLSLSAMMAQAREAAQMPAETEEEPASEEAADAAEEEPVSEEVGGAAEEAADAADAVEDVRAVEPVANWKLSYNYDILAIEFTGEDYTVMPVASFDEAVITVEAGDTYVLTLGSYTVETPAEEAPDGEEESEGEYPAQDFDASTAAIRVTVSAPEGAFPAGTTMSVEDVYDTATLDTIAEAAGDVIVKRVHAVDITFFNAEGEKIEPLLPISVNMTKVEAQPLEQLPDTVVVHVDEEGSASLVEQDEAPEEDAVTFTADAFSIYAYVETLETDVIAADGETYRISVSFGPEAGIPGDATLDVREILDGDAQADYLAQAGEVLAENEQVTLARFFDITIMSGEEAIHPAAPVQVKIELVDAPNDAVHAVHFPEEGAPEEMAAQLEQAAVTFQAEGFSVYGVVYTVDFHWEVNGKQYEFNIPGGGFVSFTDLVEVLGILDNTNFEDAVDFVAQVENVEFSSPELLSVSKVEETTTVGAIKDGLGLACEYSAELTDEQIEETNAQTVEAGDWALISMQPFTSEETLTVTMKNGNQFVVKVTDAAVPALSEIDGNKEYILYTKVGNQYYVLKADGTTEVKSQNELDSLGIEYKWKVSYIYTDLFGSYYYHVIPASDSHKSLALNWFRQPLVADGIDNNIVIAPYGDGFAFYGYNHVTLSMENNALSGLHQTGVLCIDPNHPAFYDRYYPVAMTIYEPGQLSQYAFTVTSDDYAMGKVCGRNKDNQYKEDAEYDALTNNEKFNQYDIVATPQTTRYIFDYWDLNGKRIENGATIPAGTLSIPYQGSKLTAHFKKDPNWQASDEEKEGRVIDKESFQAWLNELRNRNIPLNQDECTKTAELYDYENRIYRVDLTAQSNLSMFDGDIDLGFIIDVSGSMQFPSKLEPISGYESVDILHLNDSEDNQNSIDKNRTYFFVVDRTNTANVIRLKWGYWWDGSGTNAKQHWGWGIAGYGYASDEIVEASTRYYTNAGHNLFSGDPGPFQLYTAGDNGKRRREYLESSIAGTISELQSILSDLAYAQDSSEAADVKIAYNTFANDVDYDHTNHNFVSVTSGLSIGYDYKGGTDTEEALLDAQHFSWDNSATKVAVLITDGAPQQAGLDGPTIDQRVKTAADALKNQGVKLVTVGLSMGDVKRGSRLLYDIATKDSDGDPYFYKAESGDELQYALYEVIQQVMADAIVVGNVTDTVNEAFYPVDKNTGAPLAAGNVIDLQGNKIADSESALTDAQKADGYGVIGTEGGRYTVSWVGQNFTWDGWHGTVYEKAKEDFLGGNAVRTNDPTKPAKIVSEGYKIHPEDSTIVFKPEIQTRGTKTLETPRVNVNELDLTENSTEWTVYLGTAVDPKSQLEALFDEVIVKEVVTAATDVDGDGFPDRMTGTSLYYPLLESISDKRESSATGEQVTFKIKDLLKRLNSGNDVTIDALISAGEDGLTFDYDLYGQDNPGKIVVKLAKEGATADYNSHTTTVTGTAVEKYTLSVDFLPDYAHVPEGQGGDGSLPYHTGSYSLTYQGHAAGEDYSENKHIINVYNVPLDVYKTDGNNNPLSGATFKLYKAAASGSDVAGLNKSQKYVEVATATSGADGIARLKNGGDDFGLVPGEVYYLIETEAPQNYTKVNTVWAVQVQTEFGKFTDLDGALIYSSDVQGAVTADMYPFNWDQGARVMLDGNSPLLVIAKGETEGSTTNIRDGSYVSHERVISFRHTVQNLINGKISLDVEKTWNDNNDPNRPDSVTVTLYRVSEKDHIWGEGRVVPSTCTAEGVKEYTCSVCGEIETHVISAAGHTAGIAHRENETAPTCTSAGGYDTVVRCVVCNAVITSEHTSIAALGHTPGETVQENYIAPSYTAAGGYDEVVYCTRCGEILSRIRVTIPMLENPEHTVTINFYYVNGAGTQGNYIAQREGTGKGDMTIQWKWDQWTTPKDITINGLGTSTYTSTSNNNGKGALQTLKIQDITTDLNLDVFIWNNGWAGTADGLIYQPTFAGLQTNSDQSIKHSFRKVLSTSGESLRSGSTSADPIKVYLDTIPDTATCKNGENHTYKEVVGTYTISGDSWKLNIPDLPQNNEYGKEYTYYIVETPVPGYTTTYSGQSSGSGLNKDNKALDIINTQKTVDLTVSKTWAFANPSAVTKLEGKEWPQDVTVHVVVYSSINGSVPTATSYAVDLTDAQSAYTFTGLPEYKGADKIEYSVVEAGVTGLDSTHFTTSIEGNAETGYTIRNTEKPRTKDFSFTKVWRVAVGETRISWPEGTSITVTIKQDGDEYAKYTISDVDLTVGTQITADGDTEGSKIKLVVTAANESTGYVFSLTGLPYGESTDGYTYYVSEDAVSDYQSPKYFKADGNQAMGAQQIDDGGIIYNDQIGYALPSTGGPGTRIFTILGSILILGAGVLLISRRRRTV